MKDLTAKYHLFMALPAYEDPKAWLPHFQMRSQALEEYTKNKEKEDPKELLGATITNQESSFP